MPKKDFLIRQLKGQIEEYDDEIYKLTCDIKEASDETNHSQNVHTDFTILVETPKNHIHLAKQ